jgi:hypothetical protein
LLQDGIDGCRLRLDSLTVAVETPGLQTFKLVDLCPKLFVFSLSISGIGDTLVYELHYLDSLWVSGVHIHTVRMGGCWQTPDLTLVV